MSRKAKQTVVRVATVGLLTAGTLLSTVIPSFTGGSNVLAPNEKISESRIELTDLDDNHWATPNIRWAVNQKIVDGFKLPDNTHIFKKDTNVTEEQFVAVLYRYVTNTDKNVTDTPVGWSDKYYKNLEKFRLPISYGSINNRSKDLTRGQIARIIASKYAFNLSEENAIHFMYENDLSNGLIEGTTTIESYGRNETVKREQIPSFIKRLHEKDIVTFRGVPSDVGSGDLGVNDKPLDDKPYDEDNNAGGNTGDTIHNAYPGADYAIKIADKYGHKVDSYKDGSTDVVGVLAKDTNYDQASISKNPNGTFSDAMVGNYKKQGDWTQQKQIAKELFISSGVLGNEARVNEIFKYMEEHINSKDKTKTYELSDKQHVSFSGGVGSITFRYAY